jgi:protein-S-isoprenylcysteine O-methyltransferase Ste14
MLESIQAKIVFGVSLISLTISAFAAGKSKGAVVAIGLTFVSGLLVLLSVFDVNCTVIGTCDIWGWVKTAFIVLTTLSVIVISVKTLTAKEAKPVAIVAKPEEKKKAEEAAPKK